MNVLARTLWGEARGEGRVGMEAVASVILSSPSYAANFVSIHQVGREKSLKTLFWRGTTKY